MGTRAELLQLFVFVEAAENVAHVEALGVAPGLNVYLGCQLTGWREDDCDRTVRAWRASELLGTAVENWFQKINENQDMRSHGYPHVLENKPIHGWGTFILCGGCQRRD